MKVNYFLQADWITKGKGQGGHPYVIQLSHFDGFRRTFCEVPFGTVTR